MNKQLKGQEKTQGNVRLLLVQKDLQLLELQQSNSKLRDEIEIKDEKLKEKDTEIKKLINEVASLRQLVRENQKFKDTRIAELNDAIEKIKKVAAMMPLTISEVKRAKESSPVEVEKRHKANSRKQ